MGGCLFVAGVVLMVAQAPGVVRSPQEPAAPQNGAAARTDAGVAPRSSLPAQIDFRNDFDNRFRVVELRAYLDGAEIAHRVAGQDAGLERTLRLYDGPLPTGQHEIVVRAALEMKNKGIFNYLDEYRVNVNSSYDFTVDGDEERIGLTMALQKRKGATVAPERQPVIVPEAVTANTAAPARR